MTQSLSPSLTPSIHKSTPISHSPPSPHYSDFSTDSLRNHYKPLLPRPPSHHPDLPDHLIPHPSPEELQSKIDTFNIDLNKQLQNRPPPYITAASTHNSTGINSPYTMVELKKALIAIKDWSSPGEDALPYFIYKTAPDALLNHILLVCSNTLHCSFFPPQWKKALMIPFPKSRSPSSLSDFRPISLLSCLSKILERMTERRLSHQLETQGFIKSTQGGFRPLRSAEEQALTIVQAAHESWARKRDHLLVTLDIRKAFDTVWTQGLIWKLFNEANITGPIGLWLADYLTGREMSCRYKGCRSPFLPMPNGVPQGAVLSPLLFNVYVNDLTISIPADAPTPQFADDAAIHTSIPRRSSTGRKSKLRNVQAVLDHISSWFALWKLTLSPNKTSIRILHPYPKAMTHDIALTIQGITTKHSSAPSTKYLGIHLDSRLTYKDHVTKAVEKAEDRIAILRSISNSSWGADPQTKLRLYNSWIRPIIEFGSLVLSTAPRSTLSILDKFQKSCLLVSLGAQKNVSLPALEMVSSTEPLELRRYIRWATLAAKLRRCPRTPLRDMWDRLPKNPPKISLPFTFERSMKGCRRPSPLLVASTISNHLKINPQDTSPTPILPDPSCPWSPDPSFTPFPVTRPQPPSRPILGSASTRPAAQKQMALSYATEQTRKAIAQGDTVILTDGSACPLPSPQGGGGVGVVCSLDGYTPMQTNGCQAGVLVTNISTEIAAIATAIKMILKTTNHLPTNFNTPNARAQWFADRYLNLPLPPGQHAPPPSYTILSDCQFAVDICSTYVSGADVYWVEARTIQRALYTLRARGVRVCLNWIPGHCGHPLGDLVDSTAKLHSTDTSLPSHPPDAARTPLQVAKKFIKARAHAWILPTWWTNYQTIRPQHLHRYQTHSRFPPPILKHIQTANSRTQASIIRLLLGQANNNNHMFHCGMRASSACSLCSFQKDSSNHRILDCPAYDAQRTKFAANLRAVGLTLSIPTAIGLKEVPTVHHAAAAAALILFLESTKLTQLFVWDSSAQEDPTTPGPAQTLNPAPPSTQHPPPPNPLTPHSRSLTQTLITHYLNPPHQAQMPLPTSHPPPPPNR